MKTGKGISGELVEIPLAARHRPLDGFLVNGERRAPAVVVIHGMYSNFYRARWKKALLRACAGRGIAALSFNNRGAETGTNDEHFRDSLADIAAAVRFIWRRGHKKVVLVGHSTGCQKATYYQAVRQGPRVVGVVLLAIGDDLAIMRRYLGRTFRFWVRRAQEMVRHGKGHEPLNAPGIPPFSAARFLSIAEPMSVEARLFDFSADGPRGWLSRLRCPVLCILAADDEYATLPPRQVILQLAARYRGTGFAAHIVKHADHSFCGREGLMSRLVLKWVQECRISGRPFGQKKKSLTRRWL